MSMELFPIILPTSQLCSVVASFVSRPHPNYFLNACQSALLFHYVLHFPLSRALSTPRGLVLLGSSESLPTLPTMQKAMPTTVIDTGEGLETLQTVAPKALVAYKRLVSIHELGIPKPNVPRALKALNAEHPNGTPVWKNNGYSVLQQHVSFFDTNNDGIIFPWDTYAGFRALGFGLFISSLAMIMFNIAFSYPSMDVLEWGITYLLLKDENGPFVHKEQIRGIYDGSLFEKIAKERESKMEKKDKSI